MGTDLVLKPWSDVHSKSIGSIIQYKKCTKTCLKTFGTTNQQTTTNCGNKQHQITMWFDFENISAYSYDEE